MIATRDRRAALARALDSLQQQAAAPLFEVLVVDNGSSDGTRELVGRAPSPIAAVRYCYEARANRGAARNRGIAQARGRYVAFCDDDVRLPEGWLAAHARAQNGGELVVNGPILNVESPDERPLPGLANFSRAFLCTCNVSLPRTALERAGGFDESFDLYGWEDTELGVRLREAGYRWKFAWDAYLWHVKTAAENTLEVECGKAVEKARMAGRFLAKHPSRRARLATGAHSTNLFRAHYLLPEGYLALCAGLAASARAPAWLRRLSRHQLLDGLYARELARVLANRER